LLAVRACVEARTWVEAGAGAALLAEGDNRELGWALGLGVGRELLHRPWRGVDLLLRAGGSWIDVSEDGSRALVYSLAALAGFHWN
jgi:hypothetical protein